ncbi:MAG: ComF family protein [Candidatus Marinimicrobia bacterium]|nr:ComF family protein [Candidatus Neomarinimicrobiota bacterium]
MCPFLCNECYHKLLIFDDTPDSIVYHKDQPADRVKALFYFDDILQKLIHDIKYRDASYVATFLGRKLGEHLQLSEFSKCDALLPVPLYSVRKRERTYNQSACIAKGISKEWGIPVNERLVKRCRNTNTQTKLNKEERRKNIQDAFRISKKAILPKSVCIIDDVFTTGATTMEMARTLKKAGVKEISILCLATPLRESKKKE